MLGVTVLRSFDGFAPGQVLGAEIVEKWPEQNRKALESTGYIKSHELPPDDLLDPPEEPKGKKGGKS